MVSVGVSRTGKTWVIFIDPGTKVNSSYYCNIVLEKGLLPDIRAIYRNYRWTLQQDDATAHTAQTTMDYLTNEHINFIEPHMWPPNSTILIPWIMLFGVLFSNESTTNDNSRRWKN